MKAKKIFPLLCLFFLPLLSFANPSPEEKQPEIIIKNRILASVNGKNITVIDVMKKMDVYLKRSYPEYAKSNIHRHQFFSTSWKQTLTQMIDNELMIADAEKLEVKVGDAEIRETIHERYGPNVMASLDELGITLEEAWQMIYAEKITQKMSGFRVYSKAMNRIGPEDIKKGYQKYLVENPPKQNWKYQVISIRAATEDLGKIYAQKAQALVKGEPLPFAVLVQRLKEENAKNEGVTIKISDEYDVEDKNLSDAHKAVLCSLIPDQYSDPTPQVSRKDKSIVHRIFYLKEHTTEEAPSFDSMVEKLHDDLVNQEIQKEFPQYMKKLRKTFNLDGNQFEDAVPSDFEPFTLR